MPATDPEPRKRPPAQATGPTMQALLASCKAAQAVSCPPSEEGFPTRHRAEQLPPSGAGLGPCTAPPPGATSHDAPVESPTAATPQPR